jgi:hypothetical protein
MSKRDGLIARSRIQAYADSAAKMFPIDGQV